MNPVNGRRLAVLNFIKQYRAERGMAPTFREIGRGCGITSTSNVRYHLDQLERAGHITRYRNVPRGIVLNESVAANA